MSNTMKVESFVIIILLIVSITYSFHPVSGKGTCPPKIELPDPVLFETTPYFSNGGLVFGVDVYYLYQSPEGMCPISSETDRLECLNADALDFAVHYRIMSRNITGKLGEVHEMVKPLLALSGGRSYSFLAVAPEEVDVSMEGFTNGTFALFLLNLSASRILIPGGPNVPAEIHYTLLLGYDKGPFQIDLEPILTQFNPPMRDRYGNPVFYFGGADGEIFNLNVAFIDGKPYLGVRVNTFKNVTRIRLVPEKKV